MTFNNIKEVKQANKEIGRHFFSRDTMNFFGSKIESELIGGKFFVTSEDNFNRTQRLFTIRVVNDQGEVDTFGEFQEFATLAEAMNAIEVAPSITQRINAVFNSVEFQKVLKEVM